MTDQRAQQLVIEGVAARRESCLYSSTTFYIWLRQTRFMRRAFLVVPIVFGALATWSVLKQPDMQWLTATFALLAGLLPQSMRP